MTLLETLKGAKTLLSKGETYGSGRADFFGRPVCICYAITDYVASKVGRYGTFYRNSGYPRIEAPRLHHAKASRACTKVAVFR